ncbi:MAG: MOSC domain-containing protein [Flavobacteriales bacterium]|nr:MOSC domain-containing protein [Flavobacteriales bacterium]
MAPTARVIAVCSKAENGVGKVPRDQVRLIADSGVEGDVHAGSTVRHLHMMRKDPTRPNLRQVHLIHAELHDELRERGFTITPGAMGENITTRGVDLLHLKRGTRLHLGDEAVIELTGTRDPCRQLDGIQPGLMEATLERLPDGTLLRKTGVMSIVLQGGVVRPGDPIRVEVPKEATEALEPV